MRSVTSVITAVAVAICACGYTSSYVPPDNFRARPIYVEDTIETLGPSELPKCAWEVPPEQAGQGQAPPPMYIDESGYWSHHGGVNVVVVGPPVVFVGPVPPVPSPPGPHNLALAGLGSGSGGGGGGGGKGTVVLLAVLTMVAVAASSATAIGMAAAPAEKGIESANGIDAVNHYNDAARAKVQECLRQVQPGATW